MTKVATLLLALVGGNVQAVEFTFTGEIQDVTCEVNTAFKNLVIILPAVGKVAFAKKQIAGYTPFRIELGKCQNVTEFHEDKALYAFFESDHLDTANAYTLKNAATENAAQGVNLQFTNRDGSAIQVSHRDAESATFQPISSYNGGDTLSVSKENYTLNYGVQYYATGAISAGNVESFATFTIRYK